MVAGIGTRSSVCCVVEFSVFIHFICARQMAFTVQQHLGIPYGNLWWVCGHRRLSSGHKRNCHVCIDDSIFDPAVRTLHDFKHATTTFNPFFVGL